MRYNITLNRIIDGDTINADICLGFDIWLRDQNIRLAEVDTPEVRTTDALEKIYGKLASAFLEEWCGIPGAGHTLYLDVELDNSRDKFGRVFGILQKHGGNGGNGGNGGLVSAADALMVAHHGVRYTGQNKDTLKQLHILNRPYHHIATIPVEKV